MGAPRYLRRVRTLHLALSRTMAAEIDALRALDGPAVPSAAASLIGAMSAGVERMTAACP